MGRGRGEGTVYEKKPGLWAATISRRGSNGKRKRSTKYFGSQREALAGLAEMRADAQAHRFVEPSRLLLSDFLDRWCELLEVRESTRALYRRWIMHIKQHGGGERLQDLSPEAVRQLLVALKHGGASAHTRRSVFGLLRSAMRGKGGALMLGLIRNDPTAAVIAPRYEAAERKVLDDDQLRVLRNGAMPHEQGSLWRFLLDSGARIGEAIPLTWGDLNLTAEPNASGLPPHTVRINKTVSIADSVVTIEKPKTARSTRMIRLSPSAIASLRAHQASLGATPHPTRLVWTNSDGKMWRRQNLTLRVWYPMLRRLKLPHVAIHSLRHAHASLLLRNGEAIEKVSRRLGHANSVITLRRYSHVIPADDAAVAERLEKLLG